MRHPRHCRFLPLAAALAVSGCLSVPLYYRPGAEVARIDRDETDCRVVAQRRVPPDIRTRYIDPTFDHRTVCSSAGICSTYSIMLSPGRWKSFDANEGLRARVTEQCMADRGYARISLPTCPRDLAAGAEKTPTRVQPPVTPESCVVRFSSGRYRIVTP